MGIIADQLIKSLLSLVFTASDVNRTEPKQLCCYVKDGETEPFFGVLKFENS
jgi:hypothetical protein